jgi:hypothetical protein
MKTEKIEKKERNTKKEKERRKIEKKRYILIECRIGILTMSR